MNNEPPRELRRKSGGFRAGVSRALITYLAAGVRAGKRLITHIEPIERLMFQCKCQRAHFFLLVPTNSNKRERKKLPAPIGPSSEMMRAAGAIQSAQTRRDFIGELRAAH